MTNTNKKKEEKKERDEEEKDYFPNKDETEIVKALRVNLKKNVANDFEEIKKHYGIISDSDMMRYLIRKEYRIIFGDDVTFMHPS